MKPASPFFDPSGAFFDPAPAAPAAPAAPEPELPTARCRFPNGKRPPHPSNPSSAATVADAAGLDDNDDFIAAARRAAQAAATRSAAAQPEVRAPLKPEARRGARFSLPFLNRPSARPPLPMSTESRWSRKENAAPSPRLWPRPATSGASSSWRHRSACRRVGSHLQPAGPVFHPGQAVDRHRSAGRHAEAGHADRPTQPKSAARPIS